MWLLRILLVWLVIGTTLLIVGGCGETRDLMRVGAGGTDQAMRPAPDDGKP